ncbi:Arc family DNA-binding protein [uncultured Selenomonas sp.]|uniref:Arc family DNA-binding protein n=1 Tax=uncultured Selenomonas sp. TaxID=159275 RepID=UPI0028D12EBA|nr:Arc family DNA-binding protein [uncultured Selenomonas sp.]
MGWIENKLARTREYNKENYEQIVMRVPKGVKEKIKAAAEAAGKSMTSYIMEAVEEKIGRG